MIDGVRGSEGEVGEVDFCWGEGRREDHGVDVLACFRKYLKEERDWV